MASQVAPSTVQFQYQQQALSPGHSQPQPQSQALTALPPLPATSSMKVKPANNGNGDNCQHNQHANTVAAPSPSPVLLLGKYLLLSRLGSGSFGEIYKGRIDSHGNSMEVAIKLEPQDMKYKQLAFEFRLYQLLHSSSHCVGIPRIYDFGSMHPYHILVMEQLGKSLEDLFIDSGRRFSLRTISLLAIECLNRLEFLHSKSFIHRDIKPDNFLVSLNRHDNRIYLIDFGLAKKYRDLKTLQHFSYAENKDLTGTIRYASIHSHLGIEASRRDDLESLCYILIYFFRGSLPWQGLKCDNRREKFHLISMKKMNFPIDELCANMPAAFKYMLQYTRALQYDQQPDYEMCRKLFRSLMKSKGWNDCDLSQFDWRRRERSEIVDLDEGRDESPPPSQSLALQQSFHSHTNAASTNDDSHYANESGPTDLAFHNGVGTIIGNAYNPTLQSLNTMLHNLHCLDPNGLNHNQSQGHSHSYGRNHSHSQSSHNSPMVPSHHSPINQFSPLTQPQQPLPFVATAPALHFPINHSNGNLSQSSPMARMNPGGMHINPSAPALQPSSFYSPNSSLHTDTSFLSGVPNLHHPPPPFASPLDPQHYPNWNQPSLQSHSLTQQQQPPQYSGNGNAHANLTHYQTHSHTHQSPRDRF